MSGVDWHGVKEFTVKHWPYMLAGGVALVGVFYMMNGSGTTAATTAATTTDPTASSDYQAALAAQTAQSTLAGQLQATALGYQAQTDQAQIAADATVAQANASANSGAYIAGVQAQTNISNYAIAAAANVIDSSNTALAQAFGSYAQAASQQTIATSAAASGVAKQNDVTAGTMLGNTLTGLGSIATGFGLGQVGSTLVSSSGLLGGLFGNGAASGAGAATLLAA